MVRVITPEWKIQKERIKWIISGLDWDDLTEWERKFTESIEEQSDEGRILSYKQLEVLERIYREKGR